MDTKDSECQDDRVAEKLGEGQGDGAVTELSLNTEKESFKSVSQHENQEPVCPNSDSIDHTCIVLTDLPVEVIVHIFEFISLLDRYKASITCQTLYDAFTHPKLWRHENLVIMGDIATYSQTAACVPSKKKQMITKFGKYFQFLTITILGYVGHLKDWSPVLLELSRQCRLEKLTLQVGKLTTETDLYFENPPPKQEIHVLISFIQNAFRMKYLDIKSWPLFGKTWANEDQNIFKALLKNPKLEGLEKLDMFLPYKSQMWSERQPVLPDSLVIKNLVQYLQNLQELGLRSPMLSDDLLIELSNSGRSGKIKRLKIFVTFAAGNRDYQIPNIKSSTWKKLTESSPVIQVECEVMSRVPNLDLANMLTPECPLARISFLEWSRIDEELILSLSNKFNRTLRSFIVYCEFKDFDTALIKLVEDCHLLDCLIIYSDKTSCIDSTTVVKLALMRGPKWSKFLFNKEIISFEDKDGTAMDADTVIAKNASGEYYLVGMRRFHSEWDEEELEEKRTDLKKTIDGILGQRYVNSKSSIIKRSCGYSPG